MLVVIGDDVILSKIKTRVKALSQQHKKGTKYQDSGHAMHKIKP